ncbi:shikimate dehydrogenase [Methanobacterium alcaliphilum]|uniref:shikimate dehydrogenase n=1 Tax=Methanobacterium alcaliphilum TaxID=392018 RepID=UPI00200A4160|nr:shikimate dehydrogenase [Methanobacterium alcaliphilum]MCK9151739.1 shikimate dehydrogenase [Methanobacterium alcaliphilum]
MITGKTKLLGLIGDPVEHSLSSPMHNAAFDFLDMDYVYVPFHVKKEYLGEAIVGAQALNIKGMNVTIPHKREIMNHLTKIDKAAELIGAVNTIKFDSDEIIGYNTDGIGAVRALEDIAPVKEKKVVILGAGGAARAVAFQLILSKVDKISILNRSLEKAESLKKDIDGKITSNIIAGGLNLLEKEISNADILIDTTPVGMYPHHNDSPIVSFDMMHSDLLVNDLVYNPLDTVLLKEAKKAEAKTVSGIKMLIYQGVESFKIWTGQEPPVEIMEKAVLTLL